MPRTMTAEARKAISKAQRKRWKAFHAAQTAPDAEYVVPIPLATPNGGASVEHRIILHISGNDVALSVEDARHLRDALSQALSTP
jgi:hypothetical protein